MLWLGLFRTVASASRQLRQHVATNGYEAPHDELTDLPNRTACCWPASSEVLRDAGPIAGRSGALVLLDIDRFREVNDTLGHRHGDDC